MTSNNKRKKPEPSSNDTITIGEEDDMKNKFQMIPIEHIDLTHKDQKYKGVIVKLLDKENIRNVKATRTFACTLIDRRGSKIKMECWDPGFDPDKFFDKFHHYLQTGEYYQLTNFMVKAADPKWDSKYSNHKYKIIAKNKIECIPVETSFEIEFNVTIEEIPQYYKLKLNESKQSGQVIDESKFATPISFIAMVVEVNGPISLKGGTLFLTKISVADDTNKRLNILFWREAAQNAANSFCLGQIVILEYTNLSYRDGQYNCSGGSISVIADKKNDSRLSNEKVSRFVHWAAFASQEPSNYEDLSIFIPKDASVNSESGDKNNNNRVTCNDLYQFKEQAKLIIERARMDGIIPQSNPEKHEYENVKNFIASLPSDFKDKLKCGTYSVLADIVRVSDGGFMMNQNTQVASNNGNGTLVYPCCTNKEQHKELKCRVEFENDSWFCKKCQKKSPRCNYAFLAHIGISDNTIEQDIDVTAFGGLDRIINMDAESLLRQHEGGGGGAEESLSPVAHINHNQDMVFTVNSIISNNPKLIVFYIQAKPHPEQGLVFQLLEFKNPKYEDEVDRLVYQVEQSNLN